MSVGVGDTIRDVLRRLYPTRARKGQLEIAPPGPPDVFAAAAYLLQISGGYHHVQPDGDHGKTASPRILHVTEDLRKRSKRIGGQWRKLPLKPFRAPKSVQNLWTALLAQGDEQIFRELLPTDTCPSWWGIVLELMLIADAAAADEVGWVPSNKLRAAWLPLKHIVKEETKSEKSLLNTIAFETNQDMVNVLPKARTPSVGCTLRSLSHHLALLPPRGVARAYWVSPYERALGESDALNILIVPYPYHVSARDFHSRSPAGVVRKRRWGWFEVESAWLKRLEKDDFLEFVRALVKQAETDCSQVHGVVLPELALDWEQYAILVDEMKKVKEIEFVISGVSSTKEGRKGNFVAMTMYGRLTDEVTTRTREKHHRWKLEDHQIGGYALSSALSPNANWWEKLDIMSRSIDVFVFREDSCLTTLICEDLARVDPCQELVRSIGPNLVIALLMDSAQIKERWPARYATVLAEDPGSSVLTVTSRALVDRFNDEGAKARSNAIALWRDDTGMMRPIELPEGRDAVVLTLAGHRQTARTLDGRAANNSMSWRYHGQQPITADIPDSLRKKIRGR